jgi:hypothetical protein
VFSDASKCLACWRAHRDLGDFARGSQALGFILCWDFDRSIVFDQTAFAAISETEERFLKQSINSDGHHLYFLDSPKVTRKIEVIRLREYLSERLGIDFK